MDSTYNKLIRFYIPLALTSVMMNLSAPILNSAISLSADSISQIAAFAVAFAMATLTHSPVFTVQQIAIAKAINRQNVRKLILYFLVISIVLININALFAFTPLGDLLFMKFMGASVAVSSSAKLTLAAFLPLPLFISFRGVFQGMLIRKKDTMLISIATLARLFSLLLAVFMVKSLHINFSAPIGALALTGTVLIETVILCFKALDYYRKMEEGIDNPNFVREISRFSWPLVISMILWTSSTFFLTAIVSHSIERDAALAVVGIVFASIGWFAASPAKPVMQLIMVYGAEDNVGIEVRRFIFSLVAVLSLFILILQLSPIRDFIFSYIFYLDDHLKALAENTLWLILAYPLLIAHRGYLQGNLLRLEKTRPISVAAFVRVASLAIALFMSYQISFENGAFYGVLILLLSVLMENLLLMRSLVIIKKELQLVF